MLNLGWQDDAACQDTYTELWDLVADRPETVEPHILKAMKRLCEGCPVRYQCLEHALLHEPVGLWGGKTARERKAIRRDRGMSAIRVVA